MKQLHLDQVMGQIESAFGAELPFSEHPLGKEDREVLRRVFGDDGYQCYLQDQVSRQIIRDYLVNAILLGFLAKSELDVLTGRIATREGRSALSLRMLMSSVEQAAQLLQEGEPQPLKPLEPSPQSPPHIHLVRN